MVSAGWDEPQSSGPSALAATFASVFLRRMAQPLGAAGAGAKKEPPVTGGFKS